MRLHWKPRQKRIGGRRKKRMGNRIKPDADLSQKNYISYKLVTKSVATIRFGIKFRVSLFFDSYKIVTAESEN